MSEAWNCQNARRAGPIVALFSPRLGDHHHHRVRKAAAAQVQQFENETS